MMIDGHDWIFDGIALSLEIPAWQIGWCRAALEDGTPTGELWLCMGPLAICFV